MGPIRVTRCGFAERHCALLSLLLLAVGGCEGCYDEPGKLRGSPSRGSASVVVPQVQRFLLETGDAFVTIVVLKVVRRRLEPLGIESSAASIVGDAVQVDVPAAKSEAAAEALAGGRLDIKAGDEVVIRGESLVRADATDDALVLVFKGRSKTALARVVKEKRDLLVLLDGDVVAQFKADDYKGIALESGTLSVKMTGDRVKQLAKRLTGKALGHQTKLVKKEKKK